MPEPDAIGWLLAMSGEPFASAIIHPDHDWDDAQADPDEATKDSFQQ